MSAQVPVIPMPIASTLTLQKPSKNFNTVENRSLAPLQAKLLCFIFKCFLNYLFKSSYRARLIPPVL